MKFMAVYMKLYIRDRNLVLSTVALFVVKNFLYNILSLVYVPLPPQFNYQREQYASISGSVMEKLDIGSSISPHTSSQV